MKKSSASVVVVRPERLQGGGVVAFLAVQLLVALWHQIQPLAVQRQAVAQKNPIPFHPLYGDKGAAGFDELAQKAGVALEHLGADASLVGEGEEAGVLQQGVVVLLDCSGGEDRVKFHGRHGFQVGVEEGDVG